MGEDNYNPWTSQTHVEYVPLWKVIAAEAFSLLFIVAGICSVVWMFVAVLFSLEKI